MKGMGGKDRNNANAGGWVEGETDSVAEKQDRSLKDGEGDRGVTGKTDATTICFCFRTFARYIRVFPLGRLL